MRYEYGGYLEIEKGRGQLLYPTAIGLNSGRNCLRFLIRKRHIKKLVLPNWYCDAITDVCTEEKVHVRFYDVARDDFKPIINEVFDNEWLYVINYFGYLNNRYLSNLKKKYPRIIIDNAQAFFSKPLAGVDTIYTCRKFFGVTDGAYLVTDLSIDKMDYDYSSERINFLYGRLETSASDYYSKFQENEKLISTLPILHMSKTTENIMKSIDYEYASSVRKRNYEFLEKELNKINKLNQIIPQGPYMYPLLVENGNQIKKKLIERKIYVPTLWPNIIENASKSSNEYYLSNNLVPLPCDQRYSIKDMNIIAREVRKIMENGN